MPSSIRLVVLLTLVTTPAVAVSLGPTSQSAAGTLPHDDDIVADGNVTVLRGTEGLFERVHSPADIRAARADGRLRDHDHFTRGDTVVLQFHAPNLIRSLADTEGENLTDRFFRLRNQSAFDLSVHSRYISPSELPGQLFLNRTNTRVLSDPANGTVWVVVDTTAGAVLGRGDGGEVDQSLDRFPFEAVVEIPLDTEERRVLVGKSKFVETSAVTRSPTVRAAFSGSPWTLSRNATGWFVVNVTTTLFPGSNVTVRAVTPNGTVLAQQRVQTNDSATSGVRADTSTLQTTLLLGDISPATEFDLRLLSQNESVATDHVAVGRPAKLWNTSARFLETGPHAGEIRVSTTLHLPDEGFLTVGGSDNPTVRRIPEDEAVRVTVYVNRSTVGDGEVRVVGIWDHDDDGEYDEDDHWFPTTADRQATQEEAGDLVRYHPVSNWTPPTATATATPTASWSQSPTASPTATDGSTSSAGTQTGQTTTGASGFGWLPALVGVLVCSILSAFDSIRE